MTASLLTSIQTTALAAVINVNPDPSLPGNTGAIAETILSWVLGGVFVLCVVLFVVQLGKFASATHKGEQSDGARNAMVVLLVAGLASFAGTIVLAISNIGAGAG